MPEDTCDASQHRAVARGSCIIIENSQLIYAGPLATAPDAAGAMLLMNPEDYARFSEEFARREEMGAYLRRRH